MIDIIDEASWHVAAREDLLDRAFGHARFEKASERLREGRLPFIALSAVDGEALVGTVRLWKAATGDGRDVLLLGPLAVSADVRGGGVGGRLMRTALNRAAVAGQAAVILVGDPSYYARFGFSQGHTGALSMPGAFDQWRLLALELVEGSLTGAVGTLQARAPLAGSGLLAGDGLLDGVLRGPWPPAS